MAKKGDARKTETQTTFPRRGPCRSQEGPNWSREGPNWWDKLGKRLRISPQSLRQNLPVILILAILCLVAYANALDNEFVSDDLKSIVEYPHLGNLWLELRGLNGTNFINGLIFLLLGKNLFAYHFVNLVTHAVASFLVYRFVLAVARARNLALFSALLFALHPIHTEAVTWISGGSYINFTISFLATFLVFDRYLEGPRRKLYLGLCLVGYALALFFSVWAAPLPFLLFLYEVYVRKQRPTWLFYLGLLGVALVFAYVMRQGISARANILVEQAGTSLVDLSITAPYSIIWYSKLLAWPRDLTLYHENETLLGVLLWPARLLLLGVFVILPIVFRKKRLLVFFLAFFLSGVCLSLSPIQIAWLVAERYVYLASISFCVLLAYLLLLAEKRLGVKNLARGLLIPILVLYFVRTYQRNEDWQTPDRLWAATVRVSPSSQKAHNNMGDVYFRQKNWDGAIAEFEMARKFQPRYADATYNLANTYLEFGDLVNAEKYFLEALEYNPALYQTHNNLGEVYARTGRLDQAISEFTLAKGLQSGVVSPTHNLGRIYQAQGNIEMAKKLYLEAIKMDSNSYLSYYQLGEVAYLEGDLGAAQNYLEQALRVSPDYAPAKKLLGELRNQGGQ